MAKQTNTNRDKRETPTQQGLNETLASIHPRLALWLRQGLLVLIALLALLLVVRQVRASREAKAARAYAELADAVSAEDFDRVAAAYPGTSIAHHASLAAAQKLFGKGEYNQAFERFATVAASNDPTIALRASLGQALAREAQSQTEARHLDEARELFAAAGSRAATLGLVAEQVDALLGQARCHQRNGDTAQARELVENARNLSVDPTLGRRITTAGEALDTYELASLAPPPPADDETEPDAE